MQTEISANFLIPNLAKCQPIGENSTKSIFFVPDTSQNIWNQIGGLVMLKRKKKHVSTSFFGGGGEITKGDSGEKPESVSRVSEKTLTNLISEFQKKKFS